MCISNSRRGLFIGYSQFIYPQNSYFHPMCLGFGIGHPTLWLLCLDWTSREVTSRVWVRLATQMTSWFHHCMTDIIFLPLTWLVPLRRCPTTLPSAAVKLGLLNPEALVNNPGLLQLTCLNGKENHTSINTWLTGNRIYAL